MRPLPALLFLAACSASTPSEAPDPVAPIPDAAPDPAWVTALDAWHAARVERLTAEDGWLALAGLVWLDDEGLHPVGTDADDAVTLPRGAADVGAFSRSDGEIAFIAVEGVPVTVDGAPLTGSVTLRTDQSPAGPSVLTHGDVAFHVIDRDGRLGVRIKDPQAPTRTGFAGIPRFAPDPAWRVTARLEPHAAPTTLAVPTVLGTTLQEPSPGVLVFEVDGTEHRLHPVGDSDGLFLVFGDASNGDTTYGGGRFLSAPGASDDGAVELDFNKAINPPCAFTAFATCPLPPRENKLAVAVEAGEKVPAGAEGHGPG